MQIAIELSGVQRKRIHDSPSYTPYCWLLLQAAMGCAALSAAVCLFQEACCTHGHTQRWTPASTLIDSSLERCRGTAFAAWWVNTGNWHSDGRRSTASGLDEARARSLDWLFKGPGSSCNKDDLVRELVLRKIGAWDCTALPRRVPLELQDFEADD